MPICSGAVTDKAIFFLYLSVESSYYLPAMMHWKGENLLAYLLRQSIGKAKISLLIYYKNTAREKNFRGGEGRTLMWSP